MIPSQIAGMALQVRHGELRTVTSGQVRMRCVLVIHGRAGTDSRGVAESGKARPCDAGTESYGPMLQGMDGSA